ncbi:hypothetical protein AYI68_g5183 [Smittium mucronatum]|uniref:SCP domain-containing protein n=1 Tax=Smittium mucronatum TaxID=133383 RepID=A0A1R0GV21_9FUNG|nr:hypothetical protein AYI68_g5183 [Smittium mucronatum]
MVSVRVFLLSAIFSTCFSAPSVSLKHDKNENLKYSVKEKMESGEPKIIIELENYDTGSVDSQSYSKRNHSEIYNSDRPTKLPQWIELIIKGDDEINTKEEIERMNKTLNSYREKVGKEELVYSPELSKAALIQSQYQKNENIITHGNKYLNSLSDRIKSIGKNCTRCSENVFMGNGTIEEVMGEWYNSTGHRKNILGDTAEYGFAKSGEYWTQVFNRE